VALCGCWFDERGLPFDPPDGPTPLEADAGARPDAAASAVDAAAPDTAPADCPLNYARLGDAGTVYRLGYGTATWDAGEADCDDDGVGTHLVVLDDQDEMELIASLIGDGDAWIGVTDRVTPRRWLTVLGDEAPLLPWRQGAPDASGTACVTVLADGKQIDDTSCASVRRYVCECDGVEPKPGAFASIAASVAADVALGSGK